MAKGTYKNIPFEFVFDNPNVKVHLKAAVEQLKKLVTVNDVPALYNNIVHSGEDDKENR